MTKKNSDFDGIVVLEIEVETRYKDRSPLSTRVALSEAWRGVLSVTQLEKLLAATELPPLKEWRLTEGPDRAITVCCPGDHELGGTWIDLRDHHDRDAVHYFLRYTCVREAQVPDNVLVQEAGVQYAE